MKNKLIYSLLVVFPLLTYGQTVHKCYAKEAIDYQNNLSPGFKEQVDEQFDLAKAWADSHAPKRTTYTIPVVFHVVYNTAEENISDEIIQNQLDILNQDFARLNADTTNTRDDFQALVGPTNIRFAFAEVDPNGNPTNGITRTQTSIEYFGSLNLDFAQLEKVKSTSDGGIDAWDQTHYLNIWICDMSYDFFGTPIPMLLGYATPPVGLPNWPPDSGTEDLGDGVVLQYHTVGDHMHNINDFLPETMGRTAVHEVGHYLGLRHIWGDGDCTTDDGINDTPDAIEASEADCNFNKNTCNADVMGFGDLKDMVENYMDYSSELCQNSFTKEQVALMHAVLENQRQELVLTNFGVGLTEELPSMFNVFPNPISNVLNLSSKNEMKTVRIYDLNGSILMEKEVLGLTHSITMNDLAGGVYIVKAIFANGQSAQKKITKK